MYGIARIAIWCVVQTIYFFIQLLNTLQTGAIHVFELFALYAWAVWIVKWISAKMYRPYTNSNETATVAVIVPVLNEDPFVFNDCLKSIKAQKPTEFYVILDVNENDPLLEQIAGAYALTIRAKDVGKRAAVATGIDIARSDIIIVVDSDTIFEPDCINELKKPFLDPKVGGVTTNQKIFNPEGNNIRRIAAWMEDVRFSIGSIPSQSTFKQVGCLPGRAVAYRRTAIVPCIPEFLNETFWGVKCVTGDDRELTNLMLQNGWHTVLQSPAIVYTDCPNDLNTFIKQQIRWARSSQRETIKSLPWLWKKPFTLFTYLTDILTPIFFVLVIAISLFAWLTGSSYFNFPLWAAVPMGIIGMSLTLGIKQYPHLLRKPHDIKFLVIYATFMMFIMTPIRIYGLLTMRDNEWMTRGG